MATEQAVLTRTSNRSGLLKNYFYFSMSLLIAVTVVYGFSHTINADLIHPDIPRPFLLSIHAAVFSGWVVFYILQSALVRTHNVRLHRKLGWFGVGLGVLIPVVGISTAIVMANFKIAHYHSASAAAFLIVPFFDIAAFTVTFALAIYWRKTPEFHRRLMLMATCVLTAAAFGRFPEYLLPRAYFYVGVDLLIFLGVARDLIVDRRFHRPYRYGLPALIVGQIFVMYTFIHDPAYWQKITHAILS